MRKLVIALALTFLFLTAGYADTQYIAGVLKITLRTGPGTDHRVLTMIKTGEEVEVIDSSNPDWTRIRLTSGKEGWVMSRFLTDSRPMTPAGEPADLQNEALAGQVDELRKENDTLKKDFNHTSTELAQTRKKLAALKRTYRKKEKEVSNHIKLQARYRQSISDLAEQTRRADSLSTTIEKDRFYDKIKWFLSGAGVLLLGFLFGMGFLLIHKDMFKIK